MPKNVIHNLTSIKIPFEVSFILSLGLSFSCTTLPKRDNFIRKFKENIRRLCWIIQFSLDKKERENRLTEFDRFLIQCKKRCNFIKHSSKLQEKIFPNPFLANEAWKLILSKYNGFQFPPTELLEFASNFIKNNGLIIKNADKNAGICVMYKDMYETEIFRQLNLSDTYRPSCKVEYERAMENFVDKAKTMKLQLNSDISLPTIIPFKHNASSFYILPKIHKKFDKFPPGRPISSTCNTINRNISSLVDHILKPIMATTPTVILDTSHFLLLIDNVKLESNRKYSLITYDVESMYTSLRTSICKKRCMQAFREHIKTNNYDFNITCRDFKQLLDLSLDFSYLKYNNEYFFQHAGIQMGNAASVTIANVTAYYELLPMFEGYENIVFNVRFIDDGFIIIDSTDIEVEVWCQNTFKHNYLKFTVNSSDDTIDFLDVTVKLSENRISTTLYKKPMAKGQYLSYFSNHPKHLLKSLPYSQGMRIRRICSSEFEFEKHLTDMNLKFLKRGYPEKWISETKTKLISLNRYNLLKPKSQLLLSSLHKFHNNVLQRYNIEYPEKCIPSLNTNIDNISSNQNVYFIVPYHNSISRLRESVLDFLHKSIMHSMDSKFVETFKSLDIIVTYCKDNNLEMSLK
jgi:hypothetical protein